MGRFPIRPLQARRRVRHLNNRAYTYLWLYLHEWSHDMRFRLCSVNRDRFGNAAETPV